MPAVDTGGAKTGGPRIRVKKKAAPKKPAPKVTRPPTPDQQDRARAARTTGTPKGPAVKVRMYAHPQRKEPQKVITKAVAEQDTARAKRAETKAVVRQIHVTPVPSPDATDSKRSPAQQAHDRAFTQRSGQQAHIRAIRKEHRGSGVRAVKAELEGKGVVAKTLTKLGERGARNAGGGEPILAKTPKYASAINENIGSRAVKDVVNLPATVVPSIYVPAAGLVEAAQGRPERLKKFGEDLKQHDPVYNTAAAAVQAVRGNEKAAKSHFNKAKKAASEHPGFTAAEFYGVRGAAGRAAGASVRGAAKVSGSTTLKRIGTTERAPATLEGTNVVVQRRYSKDLGRKAREVHQDRSRGKEAQSLRDKAAREPDPDRRAELERRARDKDPTVLRDRDIARRVDKHVDAVEQVRRLHRTKVVADVRKLTGKVAKKAGPVLNVTAQRIARADVTDLKAYVRELEVEHPSLGPAGKRANEKLRYELTKAIGRAEKGKLDLGGVKTVVDEYAKLSASGTAGLVKRGMLAKDQAGKATVIPFAVRRLGAGYDKKPRLSATGVQKFVTKEQRRLAEKDVKRAAKAESATVREVRQAVANARVSVASSKSSSALKAAEREQRGATAGLARTRRAEATHRKGVAVRVSKAEARRVKTERSFLRSDKRYREIADALRTANAEKRRLRDEVRTAEGTGKAGPRATLAAASVKSRSLAADLAARERELRAEPLVRTVKGKRVLAPRARVLRAERAKVAPKATETKPAEAVVRAKDRVAQAERAVATERRRIRGVAPKEADRLLRAIDTRDQARAATAATRVKAQGAKVAHVAAKKAGVGKKDKIIPGLVDQHGRPLSLSLIRLHMAGEGQPAFLSQAPNARGARNFYVNAGKPPKATGAKRTGEATRRGTFDAHPDTLIEQAARTQGLTDAFDHFQEFIDEFGYRDPKGRGGIRPKRTKKDADQLAADLSARGDVQWQAVRINPFGGTKEQTRAMLEGTEPAQPLHMALTKALAGDDGPGEWAVVPKAAADRMQEHLRVMNPGNAGRVARKVSSGFRQTVLATSPKWLVNNAFEAGFRSAFARAGVRSYITSRRVGKRAHQLDPKAAEMLDARTVGGGHYSMAQRADIHFDVEKLTDSTVKDLARPLTAMWKAPGPKHIAGAWHAYTHFVFNVVNKMVEQQFQHAMRGKAIRDQLLDDRLLKLSKDAIDQAARGSIDRNTAVSLGDAIDRMYGRYGKMRPDERRAIALYTPFIMWAQNAAYFVTRTLPQDHPAALAVVAATVNAEQEWLQDHGLDQFITNRLPGFLQGSIPGGGEVKYRAPSNSLPFGFFSDPTGALGGMVLPQLSSAIDAFEGRDWKGKPLRNDDGSEYNIGQKGWAAAAAFLGGTIPALAAYKQIAKGPKGQLNSITGRTEPKAATAPTLNPPRIKKSSVSGYGKGAYGSGAYGGSAYGGGSPFK